MINTLKAGGIIAWAKWNQDWARPLLARLADHFGPDGSGLGATLMAAAENARRVRPSRDLMDYEDLVLKPVFGL